MSLASATFLDGSPLPLCGQGPFPAEQLTEFKGTAFLLPCEDAWIHGRGTSSHAYLEGAQQAWIDIPEYMDVLDPQSPCHELKLAARDLYLHYWRPWLGAQRVLDVGCGVGRFVLPFLDRGADVIAVDADMQSLCRCAWHAAGHPGRLDLHWTSVHNLPERGRFDVIVAAEVLCYVPDVDSALWAIGGRLHTGGALLISLEARWGWAAAADTPSGAIDMALEGDGVIALAGETWVRTYEKDQLCSLLERAGLRIEAVWPMLYTIDGPLEDALPAAATTTELVEIEERCRQHAVWQRLNRVWTAVAIKK